jgi:hypothetical protein
LRLNGNNIEDVIVVEFEQNALQHKLDSHALMANTVKNLLAMVEVDHATILEKKSKVQEAWKRVVNKMDM